MYMDICLDGPVYMHLRDMCIDMCFGMFLLDVGLDIDLRDSMHFCKFARIPYSTAQ